MISPSKNTVIVLFVNIALLLMFSLATVIAEENLPPLPTRSAFLDQIEIDSYPSLPSPAKPPLLRWDFSGEKVYLYDFSQRILATDEMDSRFGNSDGKTFHQTIEGSGKLSLKSEGNGTARFVLEDLTVSTETNIPESDVPEIMQSKAPPTVIQGVQEDGSVKLSNSSQDLLFKILFPLPPKPLKVGELVSVPSEMPFNAMGSLLHVKGTSKIKLADYVEIDGKKCAKLETVIDISTLNIPVELKGDYQYQVKGKSIFFFDVENRHFVKGKVAMLMSIRVKAPFPKMNLPKEAEGTDIPETVKMSTDSDNLISVTYVGH